jgi:CHAD domain-containing protein
MRSTVEREVKLVPGEGFRLAAFGVELPPREFTSTYHDTPGLRLARHGITLRHRVEGGTGVWQLKLPRGPARVELEEPGPPARPPQAMLDLLPAYLRGDGLVRVARLRTRRQRVRVVGAELVEDAVAVFEGSRITQRFRELEVELTDGDEAVLEQLVDGLRRAGAEPASFTPKLYRVLGLEYPPRPSRATRAASTLEVVRAALAEQYARLLEHDPGTRLGDDPEDLHQMRVATRRARAFLRAARPLLDREWASALRSELGWLGSALGPARDLDVLLEHIHADLAETGVGERAARSLLDALEEEHAAAREAAVTALSDPRYFALLDRLEGAEPVGDPGAEVTLADLWWTELERTRRRFRKLGHGSPDDELHAARIQVKRARYAAELAGPELGKPGRRFVAAAKELQDVLGEHQDACVAEDRIRAWAASEPGHDDVAERLVARERERRRKARDEWPGAWAELERRGRKARR